jgi:membrane protein YqaA with SNARE-associated domain
MIYIVLIIIIIIINAIPAFMPPTWTIVSYFYIKYKVNLLLITVIAAISSSIGRLFLAKYSFKIASKLLSLESKKNLNFIGSKIKGHPIKVLIFTFCWAVSPIASNVLFIIAGLSKINLRYVLIGFFVGRLISYFLLGYTAYFIYKNIRNIFVDSIFDYRNLLIEILSILVLFIYMFIDWKTLLINKKIKFNFRIFK